MSRVLIVYTKIISTTVKNVDSDTV